MGSLYKFIVSLFCIAASLVCVGQNWSPVPLGARLTYLISGDSEVIAMEVDSVLIDSTETRNFIWGKYLNQMGDGCDSSMLFGDEKTNNSLNSMPYYEFKSDSNLGIQANVAGFSPLTIPLKGNIDDTIPFNDYFFIALDSLDTINFLGIQDSVKFYSILSMGETIENGQLILSKSHGLIRFPYFKDYYKSYDGNYDYRMVSLIGFESNSELLGEKTPDKAYFIDPEVGDIFLYRYRYSGSDRYPPGNGEDPCEMIYKRVIDSVSSSGFTYLTYAYSLSQYFCSPGGLYIDYDDLVLSSFVPGIIMKNDHSLFYPILSMQHGEFHFTLGHNYGNCYEPRNDAEFFAQADFIKTFGYISNSYDASSSFGYGGEELIAAITSKGNYGTWPTNLGNKEIANVKIQITPNPTNGLVKISSQERFTEVVVYDLFGKKLLETNQTEFNLGAFPNGMYVIEVIGTDFRIIEKLVKTD